MPKIFIFTFAHMALFVVGGIVLGLSAFSVGFEGSAYVHTGYGVLLIIWKILNAPAGVYVLGVAKPNWLVWGALQIATSFTWANLFALAQSLWKARRAFSGSGTNKNHES